ncbi:unnamed protein product [Brassica oleracea var. botrytis]
MDTYSSRVIAHKAPFDSEAAAKDEAIDPWVRISVEGYRFHKDTENEMRIKLVNHFKSCGHVSRVDFPTEPLLDSRAFVILLGYDAKERALQLNGSDMGGWNALVKFAPEEEDEEYQAESEYKHSVINELLNDKRFRFGICVVGYDPSLLKDEVEEALTAHFSSCGVIIHVDVDLLDKMTSIYFSEEEGETSAMNLDGSQVDGFKINTMLVPTTARSNPPHPPGETHCGSCPPGSLIFSSIRLLLFLVRISVEGFSHGRPTDEIKSELINHFKSCGDLISVEVPTDPILESRAFVNYHGHLAKERALQLNGSDIGNWKALVKFAPREEDLDYQVSLRYHRSLYSDLANDERFWYGIAVLGYDTSLPEDQVKSILTEHFSSCGVITHVYVCTPDECTNIYFSKKEDEASAMDLNGSKVGGFKITTMLLATAISNPRIAPGDEPTVGYSIPAPFLEFAREINKKRDDYMTEWRVKERRERVKARREQARREQAFKAS